MNWQAISPAWTLLVWTVASAPAAATSTATTTMPAAWARLTAGAIAFGVGGVEQDHVDAGGDEVVDLVELLVQVVVGRGRRSP